MKAKLGSELSAVQYGAECLAYIGERRPTCEFCAGLCSMRISPCSQITQTTYQYTLAHQREE